MYKNGKVSSVRNKDGYFVNVNAFREPAIHFNKYGYYPNFKVDSYDWIDYWNGESEKIINGYTVGGASITGDHYAYLNYSQIKATVGRRKIMRFPDFWDGDYNFFWVSNIAADGITMESYKDLRLMVDLNPKQLGGGFHVLVLKARRMGYSLKNSLDLAVSYLFHRDSDNWIASYESKFAIETFQMVKERLNFFMKYTPFGKNTLTNNSRLVHSGFKEIVEGKEVIGGYNSRIGWDTFMDNPDALRGKGLLKLKVEEAGAFDNFIQSLGAMKPCVEDGSITTGQMTVWGTGGNMEGGGTLGLSELFYSPEDYNFISMKNQWDEGAENSKCGFFHPCYVNKVGYYDDNGNSDINGAIEHEDGVRSSMTTSKALETRKTEYPKTPNEALMQKFVNFFPVEGLKRVRHRLLYNDKYLNIGRPATLFYFEGDIQMEYLNEKTMQHKPIRRYKYDPLDTAGSILIYEEPYAKKPTWKSYDIGYDSVAQDDGTSLAAIYVYKNVVVGQATSRVIVASYIGRTGDVDDPNKIALLLAMYYNTEIMHENMFVHVRNYYRLKRKLKYLASQPINVISKSVKNSKVKRLYGMHMTPELKKAGLDYLNQLLNTEVGFNEDGSAILWYEQLTDIGFIDECIAYNPKGNFDRISAMIMVAFTLKEEEEKEIEPDNHKDKVYDEYADFFGH